MGAYRPYNPNPRTAKVGDCAVRAVAKAFGISWYQAYAELVSEGLEQCDLPSANNVWGAVLRQHGFRRAAIPAECPDCYTVRDFIREYPDGNRSFRLWINDKAVETIFDTEKDAFDYAKSCADIDKYFYFGGRVEIIQ